MRILLLAPQPFYEERGTPIAVKWVAETLAEAGHEVDLLAFPFGRDVAIPGVRLLRAKRPAGVTRVPIGFSPQKVLCDVHLVRAARRLLREHRYDAIHACEESVFPALLLARRAGTRLVYDMDSSMADQLMEKWRWLRAFRWILEGVEKRAVRGADLVLPVCRSLADKARAFAPRQRLAILHDMAMEFPPVPPGTEDLRTTLKIDGPMALYIGNLEHYQGIDLLLDGLVAAPARLRQGFGGQAGAATEGTGVAPVAHGADLTLVLIGGIEKDVATYRARARELGLADRVHLLGPRPLDRLQYYLDQADLLVSPRLRGVNTPMKVYSYLLAGKAIVATRILSHTQVLEDDFARLVDPTPEALGAALRELAADAGLRARLGAAAARIARERHSRAAYRQALLGAYAHLHGAVEPA